MGNWPLHSARPHTSKLAGTVASEKAAMTASAACQLWEAIVAAAAMRTFFPPRMDAESAPCRHPLWVVIQSSTQHIKLLR